MHWLAAISPASENKHNDNIVWNDNIVFFFEVHRTIKPLLYKTSPVSSVSYVAPLILDVSQQLNRCLYALIQARLSFFPQRPFDPSDRESAGGNPVIKHCASVKLMPPSSPRGLFLFRLSEAPPELEDGLKDGLNSPVEMFSLWVRKSILHSFGWMHFVKKTHTFPRGNYQSTAGFAICGRKFCSQDKSKKNYARLINNRVPV